MQFKDFVSDDLNLALLLAAVVGEGPSSARGGPALGQASDTLLKLLLRVKVTQTACLEIIVERVLGLSAEAEADTESSAPSPSPAPAPSAAAHKLSLCVQCLNHVKWCDSVQQPEQLLSLLLDAVQVLPLPLQIEVVSALPGISPDRSHDQLVDQLVEVAQMTGELVPCVLEAISNLGLMPGSRAQGEVTCSYIGSYSIV
jgi:hypothetical protein